MDRTVSSRAPPCKSLPRLLRPLEANPEKPASKNHLDSKNALWDLWQSDRDDAGCPRFLGGSGFSNRRPGADVCEVEYRRHAGPPLPPPPGSLGAADVS